MKLILLLFGVLIHTAIVKATSPAEALLDHEVFLINDMAFRLQGGLLNLQNIKSATSVSENVNKLKSQMGQGEKDALDALFKISNEAVVAIAATDNVASKLKEVVNAVLIELNKGEDAAHWDSALKKYMDISKSMTDLVKSVVEKLTVVSARSYTVEANIDTLENWINGKKEQKVAEEKAKIAAERAKAYGGSAACLAAGPFAFIACPIAYSIAAGVTEGKTVKDIEEKYESAIRDLEKAKKQITSVASNTRKLVAQVKSDKASMTTIRSQLNKSNIGGRLAIKFSGRYFKIFKKGITDLSAKVNCFVNRSNVIKVFTCAVSGVQWNLTAIFKRQIYAISEALIKVIQSQNSG